MRLTAITWIAGFLATGAVLFGGLGDDRAGSSSAGQTVTPGVAAALPSDRDGDRDRDRRQRERELLQEQRRDDLRERREQAVPPSQAPSAEVPMSQWFNVSAPW
ncbi:hypothetical protein [Rhodococcus sp. NPDC058514]|uniref:hypothetical protein n=1 Tax=unclassified Rhodococcus (in: high G+C Gram-positive bacteria) TaxID=192944 RepID=UPI00366844AA